MKRWTFLQSIRRNVPAKRLTGLLLAGVMAASLMACGKTEEEKEERVTLRILSMRGVGEFPEGTDENNNPWVDYLKEKTGYDFEFTFYNQQNAEDRNLLASSGLTYDLISWPSDATADMVKLYSSGYLTAIDDYESVAPDAFGQVPEDVWRTVRQDGATIALPSVSTTTGNTGMGIRADYLEKVGKEMPETFEEFKNVLIAFRDGDPDGNGVNDTIPLGGAIPFQQTIEMFRAFNGITAEYDVDENGKVFYSLDTEKGRRMVAMMNEFYAEGLVDREAPTMNRDLYLQRVTNGNVACAPMWWWIKRQTDNSFAKSLGLESAEESPMKWIDPIFTNVDGEPLRFAPVQASDHVIIFPAGGNTEEAMKFLNLLVTEPVNEYMVFGKEGEHWERNQDGSRKKLPLYDEESYRWHYCDGLLYDAQIMQESDGSPENAAWYWPVQDFAGDYSKLSVYYRVPPLKDETALAYSELDTYVRVELTKFMMGERALEEYDSFIQELYDNYQLQTICDELTEKYNQ